VTKLSVVYYSSTGHVAEMARRVAESATAAGAEVRLRRVVEATDPAGITQDQPEATTEDVDWADAVIFGSPVRFGSAAWPLRAFIESLLESFTQGRLADKVYSAFVAGRTAHGGQESTLLTLYITLMHFGGILVPPGFTEQLKWIDGNPYGVGHVSGLDNDAEISTPTSAALDHLARRVVTVSNRQLGIHPKAL
jgi:NAD(P)H dehydrogenase (quinone)